MTKLIFKITMMLFITVGIGNYMLYIMTGKSPLQGFNPSQFFSLSALPRPDKYLGDLFKGKANTPFGSDEQTAYKWTDESGIVHYSSEAPPEANKTAIQSLEKVTVDPDTNVIQGLDLSTKDEPTSTSTTTPTAPKTGAVPPHKLINEAHAAKEALEKRFDDQKSILDTL